MYRDETTPGNPDSGWIILFLLRILWWKPFHRADKIEFEMTRFNFF